MTLLPIVFAEDPLLRDQRDSLPVRNVVSVPEKTPVVGFKLSQSFITHYVPLDIGQHTVN
jgi:hypothetical protein